MLRESLEKHVATVVEVIKLAACVVILLRVVGCAEMREDACRHDAVLTAQHFDDFRQCLETEAQTVHARVDFDVYGIALDAASGGLGDEAAEKVERVYFRFQTVVKDGA